MTGSSDQRRGSRRKTSARLATLIGLVLAVAASATVVGAQHRAAPGGPAHRRPRHEGLLDERSETRRRAGKDGRGPRGAVPIAQTGHGRHELGARARSPREHVARGDEPARRLAACAERPVPAVRAPRVGRDGAGARGKASRDQDVQRARAHRPGRDDPRGPDAARLPRLRALGTTARGTSTRTSSAARRRRTRATTPATRRTPTACSSSTRRSRAGASAEPRRSSASSSAPTGWR